MKLFSSNVLVSKIFFTVIALIVFRFGVHVPIPGVDVKQLAAFANEQNTGILKVFNVFSGGALSHFSVLSLAVMPYISSSIVMQLMTVAIPSLDQMQKEGAVGRQKINKITRYLAALLAFLQGYLLSSGLDAARGVDGGLVVLDPGVSFRLLAGLCMAAGSCFVMWLGEKITENGVGNGISFLIFAGIVAYFPSSVGGFVSALNQNTNSASSLILLGIFSMVLVFCVTFFEQSYRKLPIHYAKRSVGNKVMSSQSTHLPLKVSMSGIMAAIFASTLLAIFATISGFEKIQNNPWISELLPGRWLYDVVFVVLGLFFSFFYTSIIFKADEVSENLKKQGAYIPGVRPGNETVLVLDTVLKRLTLIGALYMNAVVIVPSIITGSFSQQVNLGGTSLLIVVGVALESIRQMSVHMSTQQYDQLLFVNQLNHRPGK